MPIAFKLDKVPTDAIPEYEPLILAEGTVPDARLVAFRLVRLAPFPKNPVAVAIPMTFRLERFPTEVIPE